MEALGVHEMVYKSVMKTDIDLRKDFFYTVLPVGGSTMLPGFSTRLQSEIQSLVPLTTRVRVDERPERKYSTWVRQTHTLIFCSASELLSIFVDRRIHIGISFEI
jgi:actin, other eukaryote